MYRAAIWVCYYFICTVCPGFAISLRPFYPCYIWNIVLPDYFKTGLVRNLFQSDILSVQKNKLIKLTLILALIIRGAGISYLIMTFHFRHMVSFTAASTEPIREWWAQQVQSTESKNSSTAQEKYWIHFLYLSRF